MQKNQDGPRKLPASQSGWQCITLSQNSMRHAARRTSIFSFVISASRHFGQINVCKYLISTIKGFPHLGNCVKKNDSLGRQKKRCLRIEMTSFFSLELMISFFSNWTASLSAASTGTFFQSQIIGFSEMSSLLLSFHGWKRKKSKIIILYSRIKSKKKCQKNQTSG